MTQEVDNDLLSSLKIQANHNLNRLKSLHEEKKNNKVFDNEREKSLGLYLEEQEKWDSSREKGLAEYRRQKKTLSPSDDGPEYKEEQIRRKKNLDVAEKNREVQVRTRNQVLNQNPGVVTRLEDEELGLLETRPRYELRLRGKNKWIKNGAATGGRAAVGGQGGYTPPNDGDSGFPPPPIDYTPAPPPMDSYEEMPPPPPPPGYDYGASGSAMPYDAGYGDIPPPPPPPPVDYDF